MMDRTESERRNRHRTPPGVRGALASTGGVLAFAAGLLAAAAGLWAVPSSAATGGVTAATSPATSATPATPASAVSTPDTTDFGAVPGLGGVVRYRVAVRPDSASRVAVWRVIQGPDAASIFSPAGEASDLQAAWGVTGPAVGGRPWLVKNDRKALVPLWPDGPTYRPGVASSRGQSRVVLRGLDHRFRRGRSDREVGGRRAQHWVVEAEVRVVFEPRGFGRRLGSDSADVHLRSDFWFLRDVPFSWAPLAPTGVSALSVGIGPLARTLREDLEPHFRRLGLPVITETTERWEAFGRPDVAMPSGGWRRARVQDLEPAAPPAAAPDVLEYGRVTGGQGQPSSRASFSASFTASFTASSGPPSRSSSSP